MKIPSLKPKPDNPYPVKVGEFKEYFSNDFDFSHKKISDKKILTSFEIADIEIAGCLRGSKIYKYAFMELSAFYLFQKNGRDGSGGSTSLGLTQSMSNGDFSKTLALPKKFLDNPLWFFFTQNKFGIQYLQYVYPCTIGRVGVAIGNSTYR